MRGFSACLLHWLVGSGPGCVTSPAQNCHSFLRPAASHPASPCQRISLKISQSVPGKGLANLSMFPHTWNAKLGSHRLAFNMIKKKGKKKKKSYSPLSALARIDSMSTPDCWRRSLKKRKEETESLITPAIWPQLRMSATVFLVRFRSVLTASVRRLLVTCATTFMTHSPAVVRIRRRTDSQDGNTPLSDMPGVDFCDVYSSNVLWYLTFFVFPRTQFQMFENQWKSIKPGRTSRRSDGWAHMF